MRQINRERIRYALSDCLTVAAGWFCFNVIRYFTLPETYVGISDFLTSGPVMMGQFVVPPCMVTLYAVSGSYNKSNTLYKSRLDELINTFAVSFIGMLGIFFTALINDKVPERITNYELMGVLLLCFFIPTATARLFITNANARRIRRGDYVINTLVVGAAEGTGRKLREIVRSEANSGLRVVGCIDIDGENADACINGIPIHRGGDIRSICAANDAQALIIMPSKAGLSRTAEIINELYALDKPLFITPDLHSLMATRPKVSSVASEPLIDITSPNISPLAVNLKRLGDIAASAVALLLLAPVYAVIGIAVKLDSPGPVFYRQTRIGYHKKPFDIIKFRTMRTDAEASGPALASDCDPRVTKIGHILRKYRLDELPQFWNVLKGEMSLVGPRPEREYYIRQIVQRHPAYTLIHQVRPGITSWGMVKYGYASSVDEMLARLPYDLLYIENVSLGVDLKILFHTINTVLRGRGQ